MTAYRIEDGVLVSQLERRKAFAELRAAFDPDATLPAFSTVSEPEIDAALMPLVNEESKNTMGGEEDGYGV
jgi:hypothetical protein